MHAIIINSKDNVATAITTLKKGQRVSININGKKIEIVLNENIPFGHKFAVKDIPKEQEVIKYGEPIGIATEEIRRGDYVHIHNVVGNRGIRR